MTAPQQQLYQQAVSLHQSGRLVEAEELYRKILGAPPGDPNVMHLLGMLLTQSGRSEQGIEFINRSIRLRPTFPPFFMNLGGVLNGLSRLDEAEAAFQSALALAPGHPETLTMLSDVLRKKGQPASAAAAARQALASAPRHPGALNSLANALLAQNKTTDAIAAFRKAIAAQPNLPEAHLGLGSALKTAGDFPAAAAEFRKSIEFRPTSAEAYNALGETLRELDDDEEAGGMFLLATSHKPDFQAAWFNLATVYADQCRWPQTISALRTLLKLNPRNSAAYNNLGWALKQSRPIAEAIDAFRKAIDLDPKFATAHANLGRTYLDAGQPALALTSIRRAIEIQPDLGFAHCKLGHYFYDQGDYQAAVESYEKAIALTPDDGEAYNDLAFLQRDMLLFDEAMDNCRKALLCNPAAAAWHSNLVFAQNFRPELPPEAIFQETIAWSQRHAAPLEKFKPPQNRQPDAGNRRLKIGYLSGDLRGHVVGYILLQILQKHDRERFEITAYANVVTPDRVTAALKSHCDRWRDIIALDDLCAAQMIRDDGIDILVDLSGHTGANRLLIFARKPAPIQMTYAGYPNTTGLSTMDFRLTDAIADPPGETERFHTEKLLRFSDCFLCIPPSLDAPELAPPPFESAGIITFGSCNVLAKINPQLVGAWCKILQATPGSRMLFKTRMLSVPSVRQRLEKLFAGGGIDADRLEFLPWTATHREHLATYQRIDIALDSFPYAGTSTTFDAMWMGVPVITRAGVIHVQRVGASLLSAVGVPELIAQNEAEYIDLAVQLAQDRPRLRRLHDELRDKLSHSSITDAARLTRNLEMLYQQAWRESAVK